MSFLIRAKTNQVYEPKRVYSRNLYRYKNLNDINIRIILHVFFFCIVSHLFFLQGVTSQTQKILNEYVQLLDFQHEIHNECGKFMHKLQRTIQTCCVLNVKNNNHIFF